MKWLPWLSGIIFIVAAATLLRDFSPEEDHSERMAGSSLYKGPEGASLASSYLSEVAHLEVGILSRPLEHAGLATHSVVLRIMPAMQSTGAEEDEEGERDGKNGKEDGKKDHQGEPSRPQRDELSLLRPGEEQWIAHGGHLVLASGVSLGPLHVGKLEPVDHAEGLVRKIFPLLPGVEHIVTPVPRTLSGPGTLSAVPIFAAGSDPVIMRERIGSGELWLLACPEVFANDHLDQGDHLALLLDLAGGRPVFFDEYVHGMASDLGLTELMLRWGMGPSLLLVGLFCACWVWRARRPLGKPAQWSDQRAEALEGVEALAGLYHQALSPTDCLRLYRSRLLRQIMLRTGVPALQARRLLEKAAPGLRLEPPSAHRDLGAREFANALTKLTRAHQEFADDRRR